MAPYLDAVVAVTVMRVLHVCMLRECEGAWYTCLTYCV